MPGIQDVFETAERDCRRFVIFGSCYTVGGRNGRIPQYRIDATIFEDGEPVLLVGPGRNFRTSGGQAMSDADATALVPDGALEQLLLAAMIQASDAGAEAAAREGG